MYNDLPSPNTKPIEARYIRVHPEEFDGNICMRVEFYECDGRWLLTAFVISLRWPSTQE